MLIYIIAAAGVGLLLGLGATAFADEATFRNYRRENEYLRQKVEELETATAERVEVIDINDNRKDAPVTPDYFRPF